MKSAKAKISHGLDQAQSPDMATETPADLSAGATENHASRACAPARRDGQVLSFPGAKGRRNTLKAAFLTGLEHGLPIGAICQAIEVGTATAYRWRRTDQAFAEAWDSSREIGFDNLEAAIVEAGKRDWRALARYLEVHHPAWRRPCPVCRGRRLRPPECSDK